MSQTHDFDKLRRRRRRGILFRRIAILLAILLAILGILSLNNLLVEFGSAGRMSDFFRGFGGSGYPIPVPGGTLRDIRAVESDIAILNETNLYIFSRKGKEMLDVQGMNENIILLSGGGRTMAYEIGGIGYKINSRSKTLLEGESDYNITTAAMGARGDYAIVTSTKQFTTQVTVYDTKFEQSFQWSSSELVASVAIGPKGGQMVAGCLGASGGVLQSTILLFAFDTVEEIARVQIPDEMVISVRYVSDNRVGILTDRGYHVMDSSGKLVAENDFGGERLVASRDNGRGDMLLLCENAERRIQTVILYDPTGKELGKIHPRSAVRDMQVGLMDIFLLTDNGLERYNRALDLQERTDLYGASHILAVGNQIYYFTANEIYVLENTGE